MEEIVLQEELRLTFEKQQNSDSSCLTERQILREEARDFSKIFSGRDRRILALSMGEKHKSEKEQVVTEFYRNQTHLRDEWEQSQEDRCVNKNSKTHNVLFFHGVNLELSDKYQTIRNGFVDSKKMSFLDHALFLTSIQPTVSVCSKTFDSTLASKMPKPNLQESEDFVNFGEAFNNVGFILGGGRIVCALPYDGVTVSVDLYAKINRMDKDDWYYASRSQDNSSSIQTTMALDDGRVLTIRDWIDRAVQNTCRESPAHFNEFYVFEPEICGIYIYPELLDKEQTYPHLQEVSDRFSIPIIKIEHSGKMVDVKTDREVTLDEIHQHTFKPTELDRRNMRDEVITRMRGNGAILKNLDVRTLGDDERRFMRIKPTFD